MTAPAVVAWATHLALARSLGIVLCFHGIEKWAVILFTIAALGEFVVDQLPKTPARTTAGPLAARIVMGALTGACLALSGRAPLMVARCWA